MPRVWDPVAALVLTAPRRPSEVWVEGRPVVREGKLFRCNDRALLDRNRRATARLIDGS